MTWTYSGNPAAAPRDTVRFLCGDTDTNNQQITDEEIAFLLGQWNSDTYIAAAEACMAMASKYATKADSSRSVGDLSISTQYQAQAKGLMDRATQLRTQAARSAPPSVNFYTDDNDNVFGPSHFSVGMDTYDS